MASKPPGAGGASNAPFDIRQAVNLPPEEAIRFLDAKGYAVSVDWTDVFQEEHASAFTVAKVAKLDLLRQIHVSLLDAQANGTPFAAWLKDLQPELERAGWWGKVQDAEVTGTGKAIFVGPRRLRTIYDTNLRTARATALWDRIQASKGLLPFLRYSAVLDRRTRPAHRAWHGIILPVDHPFWLTHFPPCGWNCRCTVTQLSQGMIDRRGWQVTANPPTIDLFPFFNKSTGQTIWTPRGIDPGFAYNPGIARQQALADKVAGSLAAAANERLVLDEAAIAEILADARRPASADAIAQIRALVAAGQVAELAALLVGLF